MDGAIKGAAVGFLFAAMASQGLEDPNKAGVFATTTIASFAAIGYLIDADNPHRQRLYRAPAAANAKPAGGLKPAMKFSFRF